MRLKRNLALPLAVLALGAFSSVSQAATATVINQTYTGTFPAVISGTLPNQDTVLEESFTLTSASSVTATSTSYATGGFEPSLILYWPTGVTATASTPTGTSNPALDATFTMAGLGAGTYTLAIMDYNVAQDLTATNLSAGFTVDYGNGSTFVDANGNTRTGAYTVDLSVAPTAATATPEPATAWLILLPALAMGALYGRKRLAIAKKF